MQAALQCMLSESVRWFTETAWRISDFFR